MKEALPSDPQDFMNTLNKQICTKESFSTVITNLLMQTSWQFHQTNADLILSGKCECGSVGANISFGMRFFHLPVLLQQRMQGLYF